MRTKVWMINGILAIVLVICLMKIWDVWRAGPQLLSEKMPAINDEATKQIKKIPKNKVLRESAYQEVIDKNLFSPDRAPAPPESEMAESELTEDVRISGEKVVLYGVVMIDGYKKALTNNPEDRKSNLIWVREGEQIGNLKVRQIQAEEIVLVDDIKSYKVLLYDPEKVSKVSGQSSSQRMKETQPEVITTGAKPKVIEKKKGNETEKVTISADGQYEIIDTPLGKIKRKRK